jgi:hypothetical protein
MPGTSWAGTERTKMDGKFDGATDDEITEYVEGSRQLPGEKDTDWERRVQRSEADLLAKVAARKEAVKDTTEGGE